jgi:hypothetical protein
MEVEKRRYVGIDLGKRKWEMAIVRRTGKAVKNAQGDWEPEEKTKLYKGVTTVEGRVKLYEKLEAGDKIALEAGNLAFIMAKEIEKAVGGTVRVLNASHLPIIYATDAKTDKEDALKLAHLLTDRPQPAAPRADTERPGDGAAEAAGELPAGEAEPGSGGKPAACAVRTPGDRDGGEERPGDGGGSRRND